jgi:hypothetical protein
MDNGVYERRSIEDLTYNQPFLKNISIFDEIPFFDGFFQIRNSLTSC